MRLCKFQDGAERSLQFCDYVVDRLNKLCVSVANEPVRAETIFFRDVAGNAEQLAILIEGGRCGNHRSTVFSGFDDECTERHAADNPVAPREITGVGFCPHKKFGDNGAA